MATIKHLGLEKKLRNGGRYGIPNNLVKTINLPDMDTLRSYMDLYMKKEDKETWKYILDLSGKIDSIKIGVTGEGIDYAAVTISDPGKYMPFTFFIYSTPDNKLNIYLPTRGNMCLDKKPIPDCSSLRPCDVTTFLTTYASWTPSSTDQEKMAAEYRNVANAILNNLYPGKMYSTVYDKYDHYELLDKGIFKVGPDKIEINYDGDNIVILPNMDLMIEDFSHRVVLKGSKPKVAKPKPVIGGTGKELLAVHDDASDWLSRLFGYKSKGVFTQMSTCSPDVPTLDDVVSFEYPIYQFDKGILYEKTITGDRDRAVWRCENWDDVYFDDAVIEKIKQLYPGIQPSDIFLSDED